MAIIPIILCLFSIRSTRSLFNDITSEIVLLFDDNISVIVELLDCKISLLTLCIDSAEFFNSLSVFSTERVRTSVNISDELLTIPLNESHVSAIEPATCSSEVFTSLKDIISFFKASIF